MICVCLYRHGTADMTVVGSVRCDKNVQFALRFNRLLEHVPTRRCAAKLQQRAREVYDGFLRFSDRKTMMSLFYTGIEDLCSKRDELQRQVLIDEEDKHKLENDIRLISEKLARINENLAKKITARTEFDRTISETEAAYMKILESSQTLLNVMSLLLLILPH